MGNTSDEGTQVDSMTAEETVRELPALLKTLTDEIAALKAKVAELHRRVINLEADAAEGDGPTLSTR